MRDVSAGRDIVNSTIMEIVGTNPTIEILQQPAEKLAEAEKLSRRVVSAGRKKRAKLGAIFSAVALVGLVVAGLLGYFWLLQGGKISVQDIIRDSSNVVLAAVVSTAISALVGLAFGIVAFRQKDPTDAERINSQRLRAISTRWEELRLLGFPKSDMRELRKRS
jgi:cytochrome c biogenesis protein ResB